MYLVQIEIRMNSLNKIIDMLFGFMESLALFKIYTQWTILIIFFFNFMFANMSRLYIEHC